MVSGLRTLRRWVGSDNIFDLECLVSRRSPLQNENRALQSHSEPLWVN